MASVNKCHLIGNVGKDPEIRYMQDGSPVANFSIATTESWKDKAGEKQERTEWHRLVAYRKLAEIIREYVKKGQSIYIEGKLQTRKWEKDGVTHYSTEVICDVMRMLGGKRDENNDGDSSGAPESHDALPQESQGEPQHSVGSRSFDDFEDDIDF